jgi:hypothetical protein
MKYLKHFVLIILVLVFVFSQNTISAQTATSTQAEEQRIQKEQQDALYNQIINFINNSDPIVNPNTGLPQGISEDLNIIITPEIPDPREPISIFVESFSTNLQTSIVTWAEDGTIIKSDFNETTFQTIAPEVGQKKVITMTIEKSNGSIIEKIITFAPAEVDLVYEAETYTPPFYKGGALFTSQSNLNFVAVPRFISEQNTLISPQNLVYKWKIDNRNIQASSGVGKNKFTYEGVLIQRPTNISVEVTSLDGLFQAKDVVEISLQNPEVVVYENNPVHGIIFEKAIEGTFNMDREEISLTAQPFFFNSREVDGFLTQYYWYTNGVLGSESDLGEVIFRADSEQKGVASIQVVANRASYILQNASTKFELDFSKGTNDFAF